jgi:polar amino acid transport system substrate-binding protein
LQQNNHYALNYQKLKQGHVALWISDDLSATYTVRSLGDNPGQTLYRSLELPELEHNDVSVAFSLATPEQTVERFRTALRQLRADGRYAAIQRRWVAP